MARREGEALAAAAGAHGAWARGARRGLPARAALGRPGGGKLRRALHGALRRDPHAVRARRCAERPRLDRRSRVLLAMDAARDARRVAAADAGRERPAARSSARRAQELRRAPHADSALAGREAALAESE